MTTLTEALDAWLPTAQRRIAALPLAPRFDQVGRVERVGDGIALVTGLPDVRVDELLRFPNGVLGLANDLGTETIGCILLGEERGIAAGDPVHGTGTVVRVPVGEALLGRIVDPLGRPLDDGPPVAAMRFDPVEQEAPAIIDRELVTEPVQTGVTVLDAMFPVGRGQRELILGDRSTGKTALAVDALISQRDSDLICVYVGIGQRSSAVRQVIEAVREHGAFGRCIFVVAEAAAAPGLLWLAPYAGFTMAEYFRDTGRHALVVVDDLTRHAATHRELALLLRQPPGREAYPGDIFHIHARLLERAAKLSSEKGGGSLTALPIAATQAGNLSAYIPTNLISITDGQIYLDAKLFHEGQKPAVDVGRSVSRVGGKTQAPALRGLAERLRLDYAQFLELEVFTRFGGLADERTMKRIAHGRRVRAVLVQEPAAPLRLGVQVALLLALTEGVLDRLPEERVPAFKQRLAAWLDAQARAALDRVETSRQLDPDSRSALLGALNALADALAPTDTGPTTTGTATTTATPGGPP